MKYSSLLALVAVTLLGCKKDALLDSKNDDLLELTIDVANTNVLNYSEIFESIEYVELKTTDDLSSYVIDVDKIQITDDRIYIFDAQGSSGDASLTVFDRQGNYLYKISPPTEGPQKIISGRDFLFSEKDNTIEILDQYGASINIYNIKGEFIRKIPIASNYYFNMRKFSDRSYVFNTSSSLYDANPYRIHYHDNNGKKLSEFLPVYHTGPKVIMQRDWFASTSDKNIFLYTSVFNDTIYQIGKDQISPFYWVDFGSYFFTKEELASFINASTQELGMQVINNGDRIKRIDDIISTKNKLFVIYRLHSRQRMSIFNLDGTQPSHYSDVVINDIDNGPSRSTPVSTFKDHLVFITNGHNFGQYMHQLKASLNNTGITITQDDITALEQKTDIDVQSENPVLILAKLRPEYR